MKRTAEEHTLLDEDIAHILALTSVNEFQTAINKLITAHTELLIAQSSSLADLLRECIARRQYDTYTLLLNTLSVLELYYTLSITFKEYYQFPEYIDAMLKVHAPNKHIEKEYHSIVEHSTNFDIPMLTVIIYTH